MRDICWLLMQGMKLTKEEFEEAKKRDLLKGDYEAFLAQCYEDDKKRGYLCGEHPRKKVREGIDETGHHWERFCAFGVHLDQVKPEFLTEGNRLFLKASFGEEKVREVLGELSGKLPH